MARNNDGWIKLQRDILDTDIFHHPLLLKIWIGILMSATWKETSILWQQARRKLAPGSLIFGMREFAQRVGISPSSLHRWIRYLHDSERITYETSARGSLITVVKWQEYQSSVSTVSTVTERSVPTVGTVTERSPNLNKKVRREEKNLSPIGSSELEAAYRKYPLKKGKQRGLTLAGKQVRTPEDLESLNKAIEVYAEDCRRSGREPRYIMHFSTFMHGGKWRDFLDPDYGSSNLSKENQIAQNQAKLAEASKLADEKAERLQQEAWENALRRSQQIS